MQVAAVGSVGEHLSLAPEHAVERRTAHRVQSATRNVVTCGPNDVEELRLIGKGEDFSAAFGEVLRHRRGDTCRDLTSTLVRLRS